MNIMNNEFKINMDIPGWNGLQILTEIAKTSSMVPEHGNILELGALFGRTTYAIGHNKQNNVNLYVIDCWPDILYANHTEVWFHDKLCGEIENKKIEFFVKKNPDRIDGQNFYDLWQHFTAGISNLFSYRNRTLMPNDDFPMFDLIIHDAGHTYDDVYNDLTHWLPKLKDDGCIIVDDYENVHFPDLVKAVDEFALKHDLNKVMVTGRNVKLTRK